MMERLERWLQTNQRLAWIIVTIISAIVFILVITTEMLLSGTWHV